MTGCIKARAALEKATDQLTDVVRMGKVGEQELTEKRRGVETQRADLEQTRTAIEAQNAYLETYVNEWLQAQEEEVRRGRRRDKACEDIRKNVGRAKQARRLSKITATRAVKAMKMLDTERKTRLRKLERAFRQVMEATGMETIEEVVYRACQFEPEERRLRITTTEHRRVLASLKAKSDRLHREWYEITGGSGRAEDAMFAQGMRSRRMFENIDKLEHRLTKYEKKEQEKMLTAKEVSEHLEAARAGLQSVLHKLCDARPTFRAEHFHTMWLRVGAQTRRTGTLGSSDRISAPLY